MKSLLDVYNIIKEVKNCSSSKAKQHILTKNADNELLKKVLIYTYNDNQYGIKKTTLDKMEFNGTEEKSKWGCNVFKMLDELASSNINKDLTNEVEKFINYFTDEKVQELIICILLKDLRFGMNVKSINKSIPNLIPSFGVQLAESYDKNKKVVNGKEFILTTKLDGGRLLVINRNNEVLFYTRAGKKIDGLVELEKDFKNLPIGCYDGELIAEGIFETSVEMYNATMKRSRVKGNKIGLKMMCYDFISEEADFWSGKCKTRCIDRKNKLQKILEAHKTKHIEYLYPLYIGSDINMIEKYSKLATENHEEGVMLNISDAPYETKRSKNLLKIKLFKTADVLVESIHEGEGKLVGMLGKVTVSYLYEGEKYSVDCGTGFNENQRKLYYEQPELILNKIVTIKFFEVTQNQNGNYGLRFPCWQDIIRTDKSGIEDTNID